MPQNPTHYTFKWNVRSFSQCCDLDIRLNLLDGVAHDVWLDQEVEGSLDALQFELGEPSGLQVVPGRPGQLTAIAKVVPHGLENVLEEVGPGGALCDHVLHEEEGSPLPTHPQLGPHMHPPGW